MAFLSVDFYSDVLGMGTSMNVILPQRTRNTKEDRFPVLILLHGMSNDHTAWMRYTAIERYAEQTGIAVLMPNGGLGWYTDTASGLRFRTFVGEELLRVARRMFPGISDRYEDTWIGGLSMGGYGSMAVALTYPHTFSKIAPIFGALFPQNLFPRGDKTDYAGIPVGFFRDVFGDLDGFEGSNNDLLALAKALVDSGKTLPRIYQTVGTADFLYKDNVEMCAALQSIGMDVTYEECPNEAHNWKFGDMAIRAVLQWLTQKEVL